jgi:hypothetical protein
VLAAGVEIILISAAVAGIAIAQAPMSSAPARKLNLNRPGANFW